MCFRPPTAEKKENKCPKCGTVNPDLAETCMNCGEKLAKLPPPPGVSASGAMPPPPGQAGGVTPPKAPPAPPKAPPAPPKAPPAPPKAPTEK
ncbi:MAG: zinc-ribbon domain-containing protein [Anaerolineales bacterium]|nr:zinc-ribbon domain-containing protein [Anaerolineales bacterium]